MTHVPKALQENCEKCVITATHDLLKACDWTTNNIIVEMITSTPALVPFALKYIRERLDNRKPHIRTLALQLLHTIIANCPHSRMYVADPDFMKFLLHTLPKGIRKPMKKYLFGGGIPQDVVELNYADLCLCLIKKWAMDFHKEPRLHAFTDAYRKLSADKAKFPDETQVPLYQATVLTNAERAEQAQNSTVITPQELQEYHKKQYEENVKGVPQDYSQFDKYRDNSSTNQPSDLKRTGNGENRQLPTQSWVALAAVKTTYINFPNILDIKFKDSQRAIELAGVIVDTINTYSPLDIPGKQSNFSSTSSKHPKFDQSLHNSYHELMLLLEAVRIAIDSNKILEEYKVNELLLVNDILTQTSKYYTDIMTAAKIPGQVLRSGQEYVLQQYTQTYQQQHAQAQQKSQQQRPPTTQNQPYNNNHYHDMIVGAGINNNQPVRQSVVMDQFGRPVSSSNHTNINQAIPGVIIPGKTVVAQGGAIQPLTIVQNYDNAQDIRASSAGSGRNNNAGFKPAIYDDFTSVAVNNTVQQRPPTAQRQQRSGSQQQQQSPPPTTASQPPPQPPPQLSRPTTASQQQSPQPQQQQGFQPSLGTVPTLGANGHNTIRRGQRGQSISQNNNNQNNHQIPTLSPQQPQPFDQQQYQQNNNQQQPQNDDFDITNLISSLEVNTPRPQQQQQYHNDNQHFNQQSQSRQQHYVNNQHVTQPQYQQGQGKLDQHPSRPTSTSVDFFSSLYNSPAPSYTSSYAPSGQTPQQQQQAEQQRQRQLSYQQQTTTFNPRPIQPQPEAKDPFDFDIGF